MYIIEMQSVVTYIQIIFFLKIQNTGVCSFSKKIERVCIVYFLFAYKSYNQTGAPNCFCIMDFYELYITTNILIFLLAYNCCWRVSLSEPIFSIITLPQLLSLLLIIVHGKHDSNIHVH